MRRNKHLSTLCRLSHRSHISGRRIYKSKLGRRYFDVLAYRLKKLSKEIICDNLRTAERSAT